MLTFMVILCFVSLSLALTFFTLYTFFRLPAEWFQAQDDILAKDQDIVAKSTSGIFRRSPLLFSVIFTFLFLSLSFLSLSDCFRNNPLPYIFLLILLAHISLSDILNMIIPDQHVLAILVLGIFTASKDSFPFQLVGLLIGFLPFFLILSLGFLFAKVECIGFGDIKLMTALGFFTDPLQILHIYFLSSVLSGIFSMFLIVLHIIATRVSSPFANTITNKIHVFPLGPFICFSCVACMALL